MRQATADAGHAGWRLDRFLAATLPEFSRARLQQLLGEGAVTLAEKKIKDPNHRVKGGDIYEVTVPPARPTRHGPRSLLLQAHPKKPKFVARKTLATTTGEELDPEVAAARPRLDLERRTVVHVRRARGTVCLPARVTAAAHVRAQALFWREYAERLCAFAPKAVWG